MSYVNDLPPFGSNRFKCARCSKWWLKSKAELLAEIGNAPLDHAPALLAKCPHEGTFSGCGVYLASKDVHVEESPPKHLRYRWISQLVRVGAMLEVECDRCHRRRNISPAEMRRWIERHGHGGDIALLDVSRRLRCQAQNCGHRGAILEWTAPASGIVVEPSRRGRKQRDDDAPRGSWRLDV